MMKNNKIKITTSSERSSTIVKPYKIVGVNTASAKQITWIKNQLTTVVSKNKFTAEHLEKYANKAKVRMDIRKLAQNDANVADRCMPNENLREILLLEIFHEMSLQNVG
ncbi:MAG: hypothetical protein K2Y01_03995 [Rhabdochlamydiaceae bacterium]|nr:hypothetical protein [Rhabdochlamydiaceae bacterium]